MSKAIYNDIKDYLEKEPRGRERMQHQRAMVNLLLVKYPELNSVPKDKLVDFAHDFESYCRLWRKCLEECPELRGKDYDTKQIVEQEYQIGLGYESGYNDKKLRFL